MKVQQNHQEVLEPVSTLVYSSRNKSALVWPPLYSIQHGAAHGRIGLEQRCHCILKLSSWGSWSITITPYSRRSERCIFMATVSSSQNVSECLKVTSLLFSVVSHRNNASSHLLSSAYVHQSLC